MCVRTHNRELGKQCLRKKRRTHDTPRQDPQSQSLHVAKKKRKSWGSRVHPALPLHVTKRAGVYTPYLPVLLRCHKRPVKNNTIPKRRAMDAVSTPTRRNPTIPISLAYISHFPPKENPTRNNTLNYTKDIEVRPAGQETGHMPASSTRVAPRQPNPTQPNPAEPNPPPTPTPRNKPAHLTSLSSFPSARVSPTTSGTALRMKSNSCRDSVKLPMVNALYAAFSRSNSTDAFRATAGREFYGEGKGTTKKRYTKQGGWSSGVGGGKRVESKKASRASRR